MSMILSLLGVDFPSWMEGGLLGFGGPLTVWWKGVEPFVLMCGGRPRVVDDKNEWVWFPVDKPAGAGLVVLGNDL